MAITTQQYEEIAAMVQQEQPCLSNIIRTLQKAVDEGRGAEVFELGIGHPHSYRGYYEQLAFEVVENVSLKQMHESALSALGATYMGWKGGEFKMAEDTLVHLVKEEGDNRIVYSDDYVMSEQLLTPGVLRRLLGLKS